MKKLTRKNLDELALVMPVIDENGQSEFIGGTQASSIRINGGYLISYDYENDDLGKLTVFQPDNGGALIIFDGVTCSNGDLGGCAYQFNGIVEVGPNPETDFDIGTMIHEYGHFLQQESMGGAAYLVYAGVGSGLGNLYEIVGGDYYSVYKRKMQVNEDKSI